MKSTFIILSLALLATYVAGKSLNWRIIGGEEAKEGQFPWMASLRLNNKYHNCAGSIIGDSHILTAAHCIHNKKPEDYVAVLGTNSLTSGGDYYEIESLTVHEDYNGDNLSSNDIGFIKLKKFIVMTPGRVEKIALNMKQIGDKEEVVLSGWGVTVYPNEEPDKLQFVNLRTINTEDCAKQHAPNKISDNEICTFTRIGQGACYGDSGGPLVYNGQLAGIVSWGRLCAAGYPDVFTKVSQYTQWILNQLK